MPASQLKSVKVLVSPATVPCPALEADFEQVAEGGVDAEQRHEDGEGQSEPDHILPPGDELSHAELRGGFVPDRTQFRNLRSDEERGEDDVDEKAGQRVQLACHSGGASFPSVLIQSSPISPPITDAGR